MTRQQGTTPQCVKKSNSHFGRCDRHFWNCHVRSIISIVLEYRNQKIGKPLLTHENGASHAISPSEYNGRARHCFLLTAHWCHSALLALACERRRGQLGKRGLHRAHCNWPCSHRWKCARQPISPSKKSSHLRVVLPATAVALRCAPKRATTGFSKARVDGVGDGLCNTLRYHLRLYLKHIWPMVD